MAAYGVGTVKIGGLTVNNPLRLENTKAPASKPAPAPAKSAPAAAPRATSTPAPTNTTSYSAPRAAAVVDPYAQWGGIAGYQKAVNDYNDQKNATYGSINDRINNSSIPYESGLLDFVDSLKSGQRKIDASAVQNQLARKQGTSGVNDAFNHGVNSAGVTLAGHNAGSSSGTEAFARAFGEIARHDLTGVNNQFEQGNMAIQSSEDDLAAQKAQGLRHLNENKTTIVNGIVSDAQNAISSLNAAASNASLPDRLNIEQEKQNIRNQALGKLQSYDAELNQGIAGAAPTSEADNRAKAMSMFTAGVAPDSAFNFSPGTPIQLANTGPFASQLPLFNPGPGKKTDSTAPVGV